MKDRPILFSAPMVQALLDGSKTQIRRIVNPQPVRGQGMVNASYCGHPNTWLRDGPCSNTDLAKEWFCHYGQPGDRLWVRENFSGPHCMEKTNELPAMPPSQWPIESSIWYWADGNPQDGDWTKPRPSIFMPRWASRILLEITGVRVEQLQDISEADVIEEGVTPDEVRQITLFGASAADRAVFRRNAAVRPYRALWESINGPDSWQANPWVWVIEFKKV